MRRVMSWIAAVGVLAGGLALGAQVSTESRVEAAVNGGWSALAGGLNGRVFVTYQEDNTNPISGTNPLYVGGAFTDAGGDTAADYLAQWDGSAWSKVATTAFTARGGVYLNYVTSIAKVGKYLYVGGVFAAGSSLNIARIDTTSGAVAGLDNGMSAGSDDAVVEEIAVIGNEATHKVYAGGAFGQANNSGGAVSNSAGIAVWDANSTPPSWSALAGGLSGAAKIVNGMSTAGTTLYVGGQFDGAASPVVTSKGVMSWNGTAWSAMSTTQKGFTGSPLTAALLARSTSEVYAAGTRISSTNDDISANRITLNNIAKWNGTAWSALGTGVSGGGAVVETLAWSGSTLWAGGDFTTAGGIAATNIAKWDGTSWDSITCGARNGVSGGAVRGIAPQSDGSVIVAGGFTNAGGNRFIAQFTPGADNCPAESSGSDEPIFIDFDGNGGICTPSALRADRVSAAEAFNTVKCSFGSRTLRGFSQSATSSNAFTARDPIYFTGGNRYFAVWGVPNPQDVVATPGLNSVTVSWKPPVADTGLPVTRYNVAMKAATDNGYRGVCQVAAEVNQCKIDVPATNVTYTFGVTASDQRGFGGDFVQAPAVVSPYSLGSILASRADVLFGLGGTNVKASGLALGLAGKAVNAEYKVGSAKNWTTVANAAQVNAEGKFSWSKKFAASQNKQNVSVRFTYGTDAVTGTFVLARGSENGDLTAPRNIKVVNEVNKLTVSWDPPKFDGGEKITGYTMCVVRGYTLCRDISGGVRGEFRDLEAGVPHTITVAAKTAARTGPSASAKQRVVPTEAFVSIESRRGSFEIRGQAVAIGFAANSKFRLELAAAVPGEPSRSWRWETFDTFTANGNVNQGFSVDLGQAYDGKALAVRLVTPTGAVYSRLSRP